jgi:ATP-dependent DNA helicase RecQ
VVDKILLHLELEQIIVHTDEGYQLTGLQHEPDYARWAKVTQQRYEELAQMQRYIVHEGCLMHFIAETLDDGSAPQTCGKCQNCTGQRIRSAPTPDELNEAQRFLSRQNFLIFDPLLLE